MSRPQVFSLDCSWRTITESPSHCSMTSRADWEGNAMDSSQQKLRTFKDYMAIARRRRWWLIAPLLLGWAMVMSAAWYLPPRYRSETVIIVEQQKVPEQYVLPNVAADLQQRLQSMTQQILSRTRLLGIINTFHLYSKKRNNSDTDLAVEGMRRDVKIELVQAPGRPWELSAFKISYSAG